MHFEMHALHTLPYNNINRDELGAPKTCFYGGAERIRVSSQAWKRVVRRTVEDALDEPTARTRRLASEVAARMSARGWSDDDARRAGRAMVYAYGLEPDVDNDNTNVLLWVPMVADDLADLAAEHADTIRELPLPKTDAKGKVKPPAKKESTDLVADFAPEVRTIMNRRNAVITLLGRMLANRPDHTVYGLTEVAHAFTVHESAREFDYFSTVDDYAENTGAGHIDSNDFSTGTFYRYCNINITELATQIGREAAFTIATEWARAFFTQVPSGKQTATAARTVADVAHLTLRDAPMSLAPAFESPIRTPGEGFLTPAATRMGAYATKITEFTDSPAAWEAYATTLDNDVPGLGNRIDSLGKLATAATEALNQQVTS